VNYCSYAVLNVKTLHGSPQGVQGNASMQENTVSFNIAQHHLLLRNDWNITCFAKANCLMQKIPKA
jgi:hypothetical protein